MIDFATRTIATLILTFLFLGWDRSVSFSITPPGPTLDRQITKFIVYLSFRRDVGSFLTIKVTEIAALSEKSS